MGVTHRILHFMKQGVRRLDWGLLSLLIGVSAFDIGLQYWPLRDFHRVVVVVVKSVCAGMALCVPAFLLGRKARWFYLPLWCWLCFIEMVECVSFWKFMRPLDGDWLMIVLTSSWEEMASFWKELGIGCLILSQLSCLALMVVGGPTSGTFRSSSGCHLNTVRPFPRLLKKLERWPCNLIDRISYWGCFKPWLG